MQNGQKLIPSVTRVFSKSRDIFIYLQAYSGTPALAQPTALAQTASQPPTRSIVAFVSLHRQQSKVYESRPVEVPAIVNSRLGAVPLNFSIALQEFPPGECDCQVTVLSPGGQKATFWQAPIVIVP